jgi:hypothetical protein
MESDLAIRWRKEFVRIVRQPEHALLLQEASITGRLAEWTRELTAVSAESCRALGWRASARGYRLDLLPVAGSEYLGIDVMAFPGGHARWQFPIAAIELENNTHRDRIAYSLWKVTCIDAPLRMVFCYRRRAEEGAKLIRDLTTEVIGSLERAEQHALTGEIVIIVGSRAEATTFPYGFFKWWRYESGSGRFVII